MDNIQNIPDFVKVLVGLVQYITRCQSLRVLKRFPQLRASLGNKQTTIRILKWLGYSAMGERNERTNTKTKKLRCFQRPDVRQPPQQKKIIKMILGYF